MAQTVATLQRLQGPRRAALRKDPGQPWLLADHDRVADEPFALGVWIALARRDRARGDGFLWERAMPAWLRVPAPALPVAAGFGAAALLLVGAATGLAFGNEAAGTFAGAMESTADLVVALVLLLATLWVLRITEGALVAGEVSGNVPLVGIGGPVPRVEPVAWRLVESRGVVAAVLSLPVALGAAAWSWWAVAPPAAAGVLAGALLYLVGALYPLRPGPGAEALEVGLGVNDVPEHLRWSLVARFMPARASLEVSGSRAMAVAAVAMATWASGTGLALHRLSAPAAAGSTLAGTLWQALFAVGLLAWALWLAWQVAVLLRDSLNMDARFQVRPVEADEELRRRWAEQHPLLRHVPELRHAAWTWGTAPRGALLARYGAEDRSLVWLASGEAEVLGRTSEGDPRPLARLRGGVGVGAEAILEERAQDADVVVTREGVVAMLDEAGLSQVADDDVRRRLREVVLASQALARSRTLWGLSAVERDRWLAEGTALRPALGEAIIQEGEQTRWMGLVVSGGLKVLKGGQVVTTLGPDAVFGEMAWLDDVPRSATLEAVEGTLVWQWPSSWLDAAIADGEVREALRALARERRP